MIKSFSYLLYFPLAICSLIPYEVEYIAEAREAVWVIYSEVPIISERPKNDTQKEFVPDPALLLLSDFYAEKWAVSTSVTRAVIEGESGWSVCAEGDNGQSWGLVQIHLPSHPAISKEQACDPDFALDFLAKHLASGNGRLWTVYRNLYNI